jgi:hypothetical protein
MYDLIANYLIIVHVIRTPSVFLPPSSSTQWRSPRKIGRLGRFLPIAIVWKRLSESLMTEGVSAVLSMTSLHLRHSRIEKVQKRARLRSKVIYKPQGQAGRGQDRGYNLQEAMGLTHDKERYVLIVVIDFIFVILFFPYFCLIVFLGNCKETRSKILGSGCDN